MIQSNLKRDDSMQIKQYNIVYLKDGRKASIVEILSDSDFIVDVGGSPDD